MPVPFFSPSPILRLSLLLALALSANSQQLSTGNLLVATAKSADPDFAHSVVLLIRYDSESAIGLLLNKPTNVPISEVLPEAKGHSAVVYAGGPLAIGVRGLVRTKSAPFFEVVTNKSALLKLISNGAAVGSFRIYAGYVGWTAQQLQSEVGQGLWKMTPATATRLFDPHPETLWPRLTNPRPRSHAAAGTLHGRLKRKNTDPIGRESAHLSFVDTDRDLVHSYWNIILFM